MEGGIVKSIRGLVRDEFATGVGPYGAWQRTARGKAALVSKKLPQGLTSRADRGQILFVIRVPWILAHHKGHRFPARSVEANQQFLTFNARGRLIANRRALNKKGQARRGVFQTFARAHKVKERILPERPIFPTRLGLPPKWKAGIVDGASVGMANWHKRATRG
jgi:hypothetical protein